MRHIISLKHVMDMLIVLVCFSAGCTKGGTEIITTSPENGPTVKAAVNKAEQMLQQGRDIDVILTALEDQLKADTRVYDAEVESEIGSVSMVFKDGETHTIRLTDEEQGTAEFSSSQNDLADNLLNNTQTSTGAVALPLQQQTAGQGYYRMPANNKALLVNGYVLYHGKNGENPDPKVVLTDSTELTERMLSARGYEVDRPDGTIKVGGNDVTIPILPVEVFKTLSDYGVIVIETHGGSRKLEYPQELFGKANCGGPFSQYKFLTTELVTEQGLINNADDIFCGRLSIHDWIIRQKGKKPKLVGQFFEVTPNYIREHDKGKFPDNTLMILNACSAYNADMSSPMKDVFFEKSTQGARFLGWTGKALVAGMERASLNLFQLMTVSNEELAVKQLEALKKSIPPQGGEFTALQRALDQLKIKSYLTDPKKGTELKLSSQSGEDSDLILMPHPLSITGEDDLWVLSLYCDSQPTATVGETEASLENIGGSGWKISMPVGAYGDIVVRENKRISITRPLHRWKPQIKIKSTGSSYGGMPFLGLSATVTLYARATIDSSCFRDSIWNAPPPATFSAYWDLDASNVAWKIDGAGTDESGVHYQYSGSGLESLRVKNGSGSMYSFDGSTMSFQICCDGLSFTQTFKAPDGSGGSSESSIPMCATIMDNSITLADDWSVAQGSYQDNIFGLQIDWNAFSAEPPFDKDGEPR